MLPTMLTRITTEGTDLPRGAKRLQVLFLVRDLIKMTGKSPTQTEVGALMGIKPNAAGNHIKELVRNGWLRRERGWRTVKMARPLRRKTPKF